MPYRRTPAVQARLDGQRAAICAAAAGLLAERGYAACTVSGVATRCGVANGTVYNYFANKSELVAEVFRAVVSHEVEVVRAAATIGSAQERVGAVLDTFANRAMKQPRRAYALLAEPVDPGVEALRLEFRRAFRDVLAAAIADGVAGGELPPQDPATVAAALVGAIGEAMIGPLAGGTPDPEVVPTLVRFAHRAIGARP